jgi:hypothetical protein
MDIKAILNDLLPLERFWWRIEVEDSTRGQTRNKHEKKENQ